MLVYRFPVLVHNAECLIKRLENQLPFLESETPSPVEYIQTQRVRTNTENGSSILTEELHPDLSFHLFLMRECRIRDERLEPLGYKDDPTWPFATFGGSPPVQPILRHSMIVVFPHPLSPTIMVSGFRNLIVFDSKGEKARIP